jgi:hypothetical protein
MPIDCSAHLRHFASSVWNWSKGFPGAGITRTLGPVGMVTHPETAIMTTLAIISIIRFIFVTTPSLAEELEKEQPSSNHSGIVSRRDNTPWGSGNNTNNLVPRLAVAVGYISQVLVAE